MICWFDWFLDFPWFWVFVWGWYNMVLWVFLGGVDCLVTWVCGGFDLGGWWVVSSGGF